MKFYKSFADKSELNEILDETVKLINDIYIVQTKVVQCFPPKYDIFSLYKITYLENVQTKLRPYLNEEYLSNNKGNLILFAKWLDSFDDILKKVGIELKFTELGAVIND